MNVLCNPPSQFIVWDFNFFKNSIGNGDPLTSGGGSICHSFRPINCTVPIPYDVVLTFGTSRVFLFLQLYCNSIGLKSSLMKLGFRPFLVL